MAIDDGPIIDILYRRGPLSTGTIGADLGDQVEATEVEAQLVDMQNRQLTEESEALPRRWQLTERGAQLGRERKARSS